MEGFDTITMSYLTNNPMSLSGATTADQLSASLLPHDMTDHLSNFDAETFPGYVDAIPFILLLLTVFCDCAPLPCIPIRTYLT